MRSPTWRKAGVENFGCSPPDVLPSLTTVSHLLCACIAVGFGLSAAKSSVYTGWIVPLVDGERCVDAEEITASDPMVRLKLLASAKAPALQQRLAAESGNQERRVCVTTRVLFSALSDAEIAAYVDSGEPLQCAGGFALEGRGGSCIERLDGCYSNVIGLSLPLLRQWLTPA